jgi:hypothetical protein
MAWMGRLLTEYPGFVNNPNWRGPHAEIGVDDRKRHGFTGGLAESHSFETEEKK